MIEHPTVSMIEQHATCRQAIAEAVQSLSTEDMDEACGSLAMDCFYIMHRELGMSFEDIDIEWEDQALIDIWAEIAEEVLTRATR